MALGITLMALFMCTNANATIYKHVDSEGVITFSNIKPNVRRYEIVDKDCLSRNRTPCRSEVALIWRRTPLYHFDFQQEISEAARRFSVDSALLRAVIHAESSFKPTAVSSAGAVGLMQLMPLTQTKYGVEDPFNARQNILAGAQHLRYLMDVFNYDMRMVVAAYNAGVGAVTRHHGVPPYPQTKRYVDIVTTLHKRYRREQAPLGAGF